MQQQQQLAQQEQPYPSQHQLQPSQQLSETKRASRKTPTGSQGMKSKNRQSRMRSSMKSGGINNGGPSEYEYGDEDDEWEYEEYDEDSLGHTEYESKRRSSRHVHQQRNGATAFQNGQNEGEMGRIALIDNQASKLKGRKLVQNRIQPTTKSALKERRSIEYFMKNLGILKEEDAEQLQQLEFKMVDEAADPIHWNKMAVFNDLFRVVQDLTSYQYFENANAEEIDKFPDAVLENAPFVGQKGGVHNIISAAPIQFIVPQPEIIQGKEGYTNHNLYDLQLNRILNIPSQFRNIGHGNLCRTFRVEFRKLLRTAILKIPVSDSQNANLYGSQMLAWERLPYHPRIIRPICFINHGSQRPLTFIEDAGFVKTLEQSVNDRSFYNDCKTRLEVSHKVLSCALQVAEALSVAHQNSVLHLNLHAGNILVAQCGEKNIHLGFYVTDFGDPLLLTDDSQWTEFHEKVFRRLLKFYPANLLTIIKGIANSTDLDEKRELLRKLKLQQNVLADIYSYGALILFMLGGKNQRNSTVEFELSFENRMLKADSLIEPSTLTLLKSILKKCLLISKYDDPFTRISDFIPNLVAQKQLIEQAFKNNGINFDPYEHAYKPLYQFLPGKRKEQFISTRQDSVQTEEFEAFEKSVYQNKFRLRNAAMEAINPKGNQTDQERQKYIARYSDDNIDLISLNNQGVLAYLKKNYRQCLEMFFKFFSIVETNPISYFNYLLICWEAGIYSDGYMLNELQKVTEKKGLSLLYGLIFEAQNNWTAASANYSMALTTASDSIICEVKRRQARCQDYSRKFQEQFLFGHLETSDVQDIIISFNGKIAVSYQKQSRILVWNIDQQKILKEIEDKNAVCMDANSKLDRIVVGLRSGLIVMFNLAYEEEFVANVEEVELGFHTSTVMVVKISKDGYFGLSGGLDNYVALWNAEKKLLLSKIDIPGQTLKAACINLNGEEFMIATNTVYQIQVFHHYSSQKVVKITHLLQRHQAQVSALDISYDGMLGVSGSLDRTVLLWDLENGDCLREIKVTSLVVKLCLTAMGKFLAINQLDGMTIIYELLTGIHWRSEKVNGRHTGTALTTSNFIYEVAKEGQEHSLVNFLEQERKKLLEEFGFGRGLDMNISARTAQNNMQSHGNLISKRGGEQMPTVVEEDDDKNSSMRRSKRNTKQRADDNEEDITLQDLFFENAVFKYYYFQNDQFTKHMAPNDVQEELAQLTFSRARDPNMQNDFLLQSSLEQLRPYKDLSATDRANLNYEILERRREKFDLNRYRQPRQNQRIQNSYEKCQMVMIVAESRSGSDSTELENHGVVIGLRTQPICVPFFGCGPCQFITNADVVQNIKVKIEEISDEFREKALKAQETGTLEQAKFFMKRMKELSGVNQNPTAVQLQANIQMVSFKKGRISQVFKIKGFNISSLHSEEIEHIKFTADELHFVMMSRDFRVSIWKTGEWKMVIDFRAYQNQYTQYYLMNVNDAQIKEEYDVSVVALNNDISCLIAGLYNGAIQFWDVANKEILLEIPSHLAEVSHIIFSKDQNIMVTAGADYLINVWNISSKSLLFEIREHLGPINFLQIVEEQGENEVMEELIVSIDAEGYMIYVSLDGFIEKKFSVERGSLHSIESIDVIFSSYVLEREIFVVRRNLNSSFYEFQKTKAGVEPYYAAYDKQTFPTILKGKVDKRKTVDYMFSNQRGEFIALSMKRDNYVSFRSSSNLNYEKRIELREQINIVEGGRTVPYMLLSTDRGVNAWMLEWDIE